MMMTESKGRFLPKSCIYLGLRTIITIRVSASWIYADVNKSYFYIKTIFKLQYHRLYFII